jgi:hypothetical protein
MVAAIISGRKEAGQSNLKEDRLLQWSARNSFPSSLVFLGEEKKKPLGDRIGEQEPKSYRECQKIFQSNRSFFRMSCWGEWYRCVQNLETGGSLPGMPRFCPVHCAIDKATASLNSLLSTRA